MYLLVETILFQYEHRLAVVIAIISYLYLSRFQLRLIKISLSLDLQMFLIAMHQAPKGMQHLMGLPLQLIRDLYAYKGQDLCGKINDEVIMIKHLKECLYRIRYHFLRINQCQFQQNRHCHFLRIHQCRSLRIHQCQFLRIHQCQFLRIHQCQFLRIKIEHHQLLLLSLLEGEIRRQRMEIEIWIVLEEVNDARKLKMEMTPPLKSLKISSQFWTRSWQTLIQMQEKLTQIQMQKKFQIQNQLKMSQNPSLATKQKLMGMQTLRRM